MRRDVQPANLLVDHECLVLIDFGIAESGGAGFGQPARRNGYIVGSPAYLATVIVHSNCWAPAWAGCPGRSTSAP